MSKPYVITYDLSTPGQRYKEIKNTIQNEIADVAWCHYWDSTYLVRSSMTASQIMDKLKPNTDGNDNFFISELSNGTNYSGWLSPKEWAYIQKNILF